MSIHSPEYEDARAERERDRADAFDAAIDAWIDKHLHTFRFAVDYDPQSAMWDITVIDGAHSTFISIKKLNDFEDTIFTHLRRVAEHYLSNP